MVFPAGAVVQMMRVVYCSVNLMLLGFQWVGEYLVAPRTRPSPMPSLSSSTTDHLIDQNDVEWKPQISALALPCLQPVAMFLSRRLNHRLGTMPPGSTPHCVPPWAFAQADPVDSNRRGTRADPTRRHRGQSLRSHPSLCLMFLRFYCLLGSDDERGSRDAQQVRRASMRRVLPGSFPRQLLNTLPMTCLWLQSIDPSAVPVDVGMLLGSRWLAFQAEIVIRHVSGSCFGCAHRPCGTCVRCCHVAVRMCKLGRRR